MGVADVSSAAAESKRLMMPWRSARARAVASTAPAGCAKAAHAGPCAPQVPSALLLFDGTPPEQPAPPGSWTAGPPDRSNRRAIFDLAANSNAARRVLRAPSRPAPGPPPRYRWRRRPPGPFSAGPRPRASRRGQSAPRGGGPKLRTGAPFLT